MGMIAFRELTESDAAAVRELRVSVIRTDPTTFSCSLREELATPGEVLEGMLATYRDSQDRTVLGAFDKTLVGMIGVERLQGEQTMHKARLWGLYVLRSHRNAGIASRLLAQSLTFLNAIDGVEKVVLEVTSGATDALRLYERLGFETTGTELQALKLNDGYIAEHRMQLRLNASLTSS